MTSYGGVMLLAALDKRLGLMDAAARAIVDPREPSSIIHSIRDMFHQRVYGLVQGWEDLNNHTQLRRDIAYQTAVGRDDELASAPTLCRLEKLGSRAAAVELPQVLVDQFIASFTSAPEELILDFDATDCPLYGKQEDRFFHGYYDSYCYLPLYVFCGEQMLAAYLRPSKIDGAKHATAILKLLVTRLRQARTKQLKLQTFFLFSLVEGAEKSENVPTQTDVCEEAVEIYGLRVYSAMNVRFLA
jgi:Transposase DDE domain group 1